MYSRYAASEGKNLSHAIGSILKRVIRNKILKLKGNEENVIEMGIELEDTQFRNYKDFFDWLKAQVALQEIDGFNKFKSFTVIDVNEPEFGHVIKENDIKKIVGLMKFHCMFVDNDMDSKEVMFRLATCDCNTCLLGNYRNCRESDVFGPWVRHNIQKMEKKQYYQKQKKVMMMMMMKMMMMMIDGGDN